MAVYLQIGLAFSFLYRMAYLLNPEALHTNSPITSFTMVYFSFITLTTVGFGDIVPATDWLRAVTVLEGLLGQVLLVVLVARLVGLQVAQHAAALGRTAATGEREYPADSSPAGPEVPSSHRPGR